ncbi:MAG: hypothetical protein WCI37_00600 [bacterium]
MKKYKNQLNNLGFAHIELFVLSVILFVIGGVGLYIYIIGSQTITTAHASNWTTLDNNTNNKTTINIHACLNKVTSNKWSVRTLAIMTPLLDDSKNYYASVKIGNTTNLNSWNATGLIVFPDFTYDPTVTNYNIFGSAIFPATDPGLNSNDKPTIKVSSLSDC